MAVNITTDTNTVKVTSTLTNNVNIVDNRSNTSVTVLQPVTRVVKVATVGPQGPAGSELNIDTGSFATTSSLQELIDVTGSFVTTGSFNAFTSSYTTGSFTGSFTGSLFGTASYALSSNIPPPNIRRNFQTGSINYCGYAPTGSLESNAVWTVTKITVATNGTVTTQTYSNVTWTSVPF